MSEFTIEAENRVYTAMDTTKIDTQEKSPPMQKKNQSTNRHGNAQPSSAAQAIEAAAPELIHNVIIPRRGREPRRASP
jgi:hypothetical protein